VPLRKWSFLLLLALACGVSFLGACKSDSSVASPTYTEPDRAAAATALLAGPDWYRHAIVYEVYVRSFADTNGDGIGDLAGVTAHLDDLKSLGVDAIWLMPIMPSPFKDSGYDVADYVSVNPDYGTIADFDALLKAAHDRGMRVILDWVLNHTSDQHAWFKDSRTSKTNPHADYYVWSDTPSRADIGCGTFNAQFGSSAWTLAPERNQYYFHRFYPGQPDLNYRNPAVVQATLDAAKFWLDRGVDGFRCDVIGLLVESATSCDMIPETQAYIKQLRALLDKYPNRAMVAESTDYSSSAAYYGNGSDMFHMAFNFAYGYFWGGKFASTDASSISAPFLASQSTNPMGSQDALVIGSHDVPRAYSVARGNQTRWRRAAIVQMTMPGTPFVYYGEEFALRPGTAQVVDGRDTARTPMLWSKAAGYGFTTGTPWLAFGADADTTNLETERGADDSDYAFYEKLLAFRRGRDAFSTGTLSVLTADNPSILFFTRTSADETYAVAVTMDESDDITATIAGANLPGDAELELGQGSLSRAGADARVTVPATGFAVFRVR
jgi:alpha-glucosidase